MAVDIVLLRRVYDAHVGSLLGAVNTGLTCCPSGEAPEPDEDEYMFMAGVEFGLVG